MDIEAKMLRKQILYSIYEKCDIRERQILEYICVRGELQKKKEDEEKKRAKEQLQTAIYRHMQGLVFMDGRLTYKERIRILKIMEDYIEHGSRVFYVYLEKYGNKIKRRVRNIIRIMEFYVEEIIERGKLDTYYISYQDMFKRGEEEYKLEIDSPKHYYITTGLIDGCKDYRKRELAEYIIKRGGDINKSSYILSIDGYRRENGDIQYIGVNDVFYGRYIKGMMNVYRRYNERKLRELNEGLQRIVEKESYQKRYKMEKCRTPLMMSLQYLNREVGEQLLEKEGLKIFETTNVMYQKEIDSFQVYWDPMIQYLENLEISLMKDEKVIDVDFRIEKIGNIIYLMNRLRKMNVILEEQERARKRKKVQEVLDLELEKGEKRKKVTYNLDQEQNEFLISLCVEYGQKYKQGQDVGQYRKILEKIREKQSEYIEEIKQYPKMRVMNKRTRQMYSRVI